jgi:exonuclease III
VENTGFKLWYTGKERSRNGVGILIDKSLKNGVVAVRRQGDRIIMIKLIFGDLVLNVISAYAPQVGLSDDVKRRFWEDLEECLAVKNSSLEVILMVMLAQLEGDLRWYVGVLDMANKIKREKTS